MFRKRHRGRLDGTFQPGNTVTKSNFAVMPSRAFCAGNIAKYDDDYNRVTCGPFAGNYLALCYAGGTFGGTATMNRGQAAVVIRRMQQYVPASAPAGAAPETTVETEPGNAEAPTATAGTLTNGKPITEDNVTEILEQLKARYPDGTSFANGCNGLVSGRSPITIALPK